MVHRDDDAKRATGELKAQPRYRTSLLAPQNLTQDQWEEVEFGGTSSLNTNEFPVKETVDDVDKRTLEYNATTKLFEFRNTNTVNFLVNIDFYFTAAKDTAQQLGLELANPDNEIWMRFRSMSDPVVYFPLPDTKKAIKLGGFGRPDTDFAVNFNYTVYANDFLRTHGLGIDLQVQRSRSVSLQDCVVLIFPM